MIIDIDFLEPFTSLAWPECAKAPLIHRSSAEEFLAGGIFCESWRFFAGALQFMQLKACPVSNASRNQEVSDSPLIVRRTAMVFNPVRKRDKFRC